jgi:hypothetical protein
MNILGDFIFSTGQDSNRGLTKSAKRPARVGVERVRYFVMVSLSNQKQNIHESDRILYRAQKIKEPSMNILGDFIHSK